MICPNVGWMGPSSKDADKGRPPGKIFRRGLIFANPRPPSISRIGELCCLIVEGGLLHLIALAE